MPRATIDTRITQRYELESLEGGFVILRKMSYGERNKSREMAMKLGLQGGAQKDVSMNAEFQMSDVARFEFSHSIVDHNLEDENGNRLDFNRPGAVEALEASVGAEIEAFIDQLNTPKGAGTSS